MRVGWVGVLDQTKQFGQPSSHLKSLEMIDVRTSADRKEDGQRLPEVGNWRVDLGASENVRWPSFVKR